jgi:hypothetical protein
LAVTEPWRSGDIVADALVQVVPAYVFASSVLPERLLIAPRIGRTLRPRIEGDEGFDALMQSLHQDWPKTLIDALRFDSKGVRRLRGLMFLHGEVGDLVMRGIDAQGNPTGFEQALGAGNSRPVHGLNDLPDEWSKPASPWFPITKGVVDAWFAVYVGPLHEPRLIFFDLDLPADTTQVECGLDTDVEGDFPKWGVLLIEALSAAEFGRFEFDTIQQKTRISVVDGALGADQAKRALLRPGATYTVSVKYDVITAGADNKGQPDESGAVTLAGQTQQFRFATDMNPPDRIRHQRHAQAFEGLWP